MNGDPLGDRLLAVAPLSQNSRQQLEQDLSNMFKRELTRTRRSFFGVVAAIALVSSGVCAALALTEPDLPALPRTALAVGSMFGLAWAVVAAQICWRGALDVKQDGRRIAAMVWCFTVLMMTFFLAAGMGAEDRLQGLMLIAGGLPFLIGAGVYWLNYRIEQAELSAQEQFLQLELLLAKLSEQK
ncbi:hypothetical protein [Lacipirellula limnantheis]|uniref:Transmembrane protein n=1 Tax=Lacipirellula limnantheis TaxID=2528024 RepID=A0A517U247_9BACT|nr:hypothetical protein [Lacipirellula limnantheis]QDT74680.1 hypothetical protein I41_38780 [Lacipirellula limnantheis]